MVFFPTDITKPDDAQENVEQAEEDTDEKVDSQ